MDSGTATMRIVIELPDDIASALHEASGDVSRGAIKAIATEGYRNGLLSRDQVGQLLGFSFWETEAFLKHRGAHLHYGEGDMEQDAKDRDRVSPR